MSRGVPPARVLIGWSYDGDIVVGVELSSVSVGPATEVIGIVPRIAHLWPELRVCVGHG